MTVINIKLFAFFSQILHMLCANPCELHKTCKECINDFNLCVWCSKDNFVGSRCSPASDTFKSACGKQFLENPLSSSKSIHNAAQVTQIRPHQYNMVLRPGDTISFDIFYREVENYPVDLYFLIDVSTSMSEIIKDIAAKSKDIYNAMSSITNDVYIGMGSFCDKDSAPFQRKFPKGDRPNKPIYSFKHNMKMSNNFHTFQEAVLKLETLSNFDHPEGGFDGLAQAMVCNAEIGWREKSRKIILFITDELSHSAGDGKAAGIIQPYDGKCYTKNGKYEKELEMDYPSLSILNKLAIEKGIAIVFVVEEKKRNNYAVLTQHGIRGSRVTSFTKTKSKVSFESASISSLLYGIYEEISSTIRLKTNENGENIKLRFEPNCSTRNKEKNSQCNIDRGQEKQIKGYVTLQRNFKNTFLSVDIGIEGMVEEKMNLNIVVPGCKCEENPTLIKTDSEYCSYKGTKMCGICKCNPGRIGDKCACTLSDNESSIDESSCRPPNSTDNTLACSGYGRCQCGQCICSEGYEGAYCQCLKDTCPNKCSGRGDCTCGVCTCHSGWEGPDCSCSTAPCPMTNGQECNNRGTCKCHRCDCEQPASWDARYEQDDACAVKPCSNCHDKQCLQLTDCVNCHAKNSSVAECLATCDFGIQVDVISSEQLDVQIKSLENSNNSSLCDNVQVNIGCYTRFIYAYDDVNYRIVVQVQSKTDCNESYYMFGGVALITLVVIGLLTLAAWKILTELQDRREYSKFMKAQSDASAPRTNPIFEPASTTFCNPAFKSGHED